VTVAVLEALKALRVQIVLPIAVTPGFSGLYKTFKG
jgi:hypothetical protein